jgi:hypothetical protein
MFYCINLTYEDSFVSGKNISSFSQNTVEIFSCHLVRWFLVHPTHIYIYESRANSKYPRLTCFGLNRIFFKWNVTRLLVSAECILQKWRLFWWRRRIATEMSELHLVSDKYFFYSPVAVNLILFYNIGRQSEKKKKRWFTVMRMIKIIGTLKNSFIFLSF